MRISIADIYFACNIVLFFIYRKINAKQKIMGLGVMIFFIPVNGACPVNLFSKN
jgi:hypothetical protein